MHGIDEVWVKQRAHEIWEAEGRPDGKDFDHWYAATAEFRSGAQTVDEPAKSAVKKVAVKKPAAAKAVAKPEGETAPVAKRAPARKAKTPAA